MRLVGLDLVNFQSYESCHLDLRDVSQMAIVGKTGHGKCLPGATEVFDPVAGESLPISRFVAEQRTMTVGLRGSRTEPVPVVGWHSLGSRDIVRLRLESGTEVLLGSSHPVLTPDGCVPAGYIREGSWVAEARSLPSSSPAMLTSAEALLLGMLLGDGCVTTDLRLSAMSAEVIGAFRRVVPEVFPGCRAVQHGPSTWTVGRSEGTPTRRALALELSGALVAAGESLGDYVSAPGRFLRGDAGLSEETLDKIEAATGMDLWKYRCGFSPKSAGRRWAREIGVLGATAHTKRIPRHLLLQPVEVCASVLAGLWMTDGWVSGKNVVYGTMSRGLADDIRVMLLRLGITSYVRSGSGKFWLVSVSGYDAADMAAAVPIEGPKMDRLLSIAMAREGSPRRDLLPEVYWVGLPGAGKHTHTKHLSRRLFGRLGGDLGALPEVLWSRVRGVENAGREECFDLTVDTPDHLYLAGLVFGHNSALLDAMRYSITGKARTRADGLIRIGENSGSAGSVWEVRGETVGMLRAYDRTKKAGESRLTLTVDGADVSKPLIDETTAMWLKITRVPHQALFAGPIMMQGDSAEIMQAQPRDRVDLMAQALGIDVAAYARLHEKAKARETAAASEIKSLDALADRLRLTVFGRPPAIADPTWRPREEVVAETLATAERLRREADAAVDQAATVLDGLQREWATLSERAQRITGIQREIVDRRRRIDSTREQIVTYEAEANRHRLVPEASEPGAYDPSVFDAEVAERDADVKVLRAAEKELARLRQEYATAQRQTQTLAVVPCKGVGEFAACQFLTDATAAAGKMPALREAGLAMAHDVEEMNGSESAQRQAVETRAGAAQAHAAARTAWQAYQTAQTVLSRLPGLLGPLEEQISREEAGMSAALEERETITAEAGRITVLPAEMAAATAVRDGAKKRASDAVDMLSAARSEADAVARAKDEIELLVARRADLDKEASKWGVLARAWHRTGMPTDELEDGIPKVEDRANEVLLRLPGNMSIRLETQKATKSGTFKDELNPVITSEGWDQPYESMSGGEKFKVDFALRLGVSHVLTQGSGTRVRTLVLDEGWGTQDADGREAMLQSVAAMSDEFDLIAVISHFPEVIERFPVRLSINKVGRTSTATLMF